MFVLPSIQTENSTALWINNTKGWGRVEIQSRFTTCKLWFDLQHEIIVFSLSFWHVLLIQTNTKAATYTRACRRPLGVTNLSAVWERQSFVKQDVATICDLLASHFSETGCRKAGLSSRSMSQKAYQKQKHCTAVYNTTREDFTTLESYQAGNHFIFRHDSQFYLYSPKSQGCPGALQSVQHTQIRKNSPKNTFNSRKIPPPDVH